MFEAVILIFPVLMISICDILSLKIKEDIHEWTYLLQLIIMVQILHETAIYHMEIFTQHEMAPNMFYKWLNIPLKINVPCMEMMKTCCSGVALNLESLSNCNFLNEIFSLILFIILVGKQKKLFQLCFILWNH